MHGKDSRTLVIGHKLYDSPMTAGSKGVTQGKHDSCREVWLIVFKKNLVAMRPEWKEMNRFRDDMEVIIFKELKDRYKSKSNFL